MSILGVYLLTLPNTTAKTMGVLLLIGNLTAFVLEIPSGYLSDKLGHKKAMILGRSALLLSTIFYLLGFNVGWFILGAVFFSIGQAFISGTGLAFIHETLQEMKRENEFSKIMGKISSISFAVPIIFIVLIPFLVDISYRAAFVIPVALDVVGLIVVMSFINPKKAKHEVEEISNKNFVGVIKEGHRFGFFPYALLLALIASAIIASSNFKDIYQQLLGVPVIYYGIFWGLSRVIVSTLLLINHKVKDWLTFHQFLMIKFILAFALIISLTFVNAPWFIVIVFILISAFNWSFREVKNHYLLEMISKSKFKATLISVNALLRKIIIATAALVIGIISTKTDFSTAYFTIAISLLLLGTGAWVWIFSQSKSRKLS